MPRPSTVTTYLSILMSSKMDMIRLNIGSLLMFSLSTTQCKGNDHKLLHLRNILKNITVNLDDGRIEICSFREGRNGLSRYLNGNRTFTTFRQPGLQFQ